MVDARRRAAASSPAPLGGWATAVGAFVVTGALIIATAAHPALGDLIAKIPTSIPPAMLAGVIVPLGLKPVLATAATPSLMWPILLAWLIVLALASRWRTALTTGIFYLGLAAAAGVVAAIALAEPGGLLPAAAGLALVGTLAGSIQQSLEDIPGRLRAAVTLRVAASGILLGIGGAFWALLVGVLLRLLLVRKPRAVA